MASSPCLESHHKTQRSRRNLCYYPTSGSPRGAKILMTGRRERRSPQRGSPQPNPNVYHRDTEDTEKGGFFKTGSLRDLGVSVVSGLPPTSYQNPRARRRIQMLVVQRARRRSGFLKNWLSPCPQCLCGLGLVLVAASRVLSVSLWSSSLLLPRHEESDTSSGTGR